MDDDQIPLDDATVDGVAKAIYDTHRLHGVTLDHAGGRPGPPVWENASENVREWVRAQARAAIIKLNEYLP